MIRFYCVQNPAVDTSPFSHDVHNMLSGSIHFNFWHSWQTFTKLSMNLNPHVVVCDGSVCESRQRRGIFSFLKTPTPALWPTQPRIYWVKGGSLYVVPGWRTSGAVFLLPLYMFSRLGKGEVYLYNLITTWRTCEILRWELHYRHSV